MTDYALVTVLVPKAEVHELRMPCSAFYFADTIDGATLGDRATMEEAGALGGIAVYRAVKDGRLG